MPRKSAHRTHRIRPLHVYRCVQHNLSMREPPFSSSILRGTADQPRTASNTGHAHRPLLDIVLRPSPTRGRNRISHSVATHDCKCDIDRDGAVATGVSYSLMGDGGSLGTVEPRCATRRCQTPTGTAAPDAVPQMRGCWSTSPSAGPGRLSRNSFDTSPLYTSPTFLVWSKSLSSLISATPGESCGGVGSSLGLITSQEEPSGELPEVFL